MGQDNSTPDYAEMRRRKIVQRDEKLNESMNVIAEKLSDLKIHMDEIVNITSMEMEEVIEQLNTERLTSEQLVLCYCYRAGTVGTKFNYITEDNFAPALQMAKQADADRKASKRKNWSVKAGTPFDPKQYYHPLFGLPVSVKDSFDMQGFSSTVGLTCRAFRVKDQNSPVVNCLLEVGAIPFVRTTVPQLGMMFETNSHLWGRSVNIWDRGRCVGGSSGGESGLVSAKGSLIGLGSDIAGSLRSPAEFCGLCSLKPASGRVHSSALTKTCLSMKGKKVIFPIPGFLSRSVPGLMYSWMALMDQSNYRKEEQEHYRWIPSLDFPKIERFSQQKFRIGYFYDLELIECSQASRRAVDECRQILEGLGHTLVPVEVPSQTEIIKCFYRELFMEGKARSYSEMLEGEPVITEYRKTFQGAQLNSVTRFVVQRLLDHFQPRVGMIYEQTKERTTFEYCRNAGLVEQFRKEFIAYFYEQQLDLILSPGFGCQAPLNGTAGEITLASAFLYIWNMLDMTTGNLPVTTVREDEQTYQSRHKDPMTKQLQEIARGSAGLTVGVQLIALPFEDERILGLMKVLEEKIQFFDNNVVPSV